MKALISNWTATPSRLRLRVVTEPLDMANEYVWMYHTTNHYGQGAVWTWWHADGDNDPQIAVYGDEAQELLTSLVRQHRILSLIKGHYHITEAEE